MKEETFIIACAWCKKVLRVEHYQDGNKIQTDLPTVATPPGTPVSHGICEDCAAHLAGELQQPSKILSL